MKNYLVGIMYVASITGFALAGSISLAHFFTSIDSWGHWFYMAFGLMVSIGLIPMAWGLAETPSEKVRSVIGGGISTYLMVVYIWNVSAIGDFSWLGIVGLFIQGIIYGLPAGLIAGDVFFKGSLEEEGEETPARPTPTQQVRPAPKKPAKYSPLSRG